LIKPNTTIPYSVKREYRLIQSDQSSVKVRLLQDHLGRARYADDAVDIGIHAHIDDIPPAEDGVPHLLEVEFSYNVNQLVTLKARIPATGQTIEAQYDKSSMRMAADEIEAGAKQVDELWQKGSQFSIHNALLEKAKRLAANDPAAVERVATASARLQTEIGNSNPAAIKAAADELTDLLFDLENA
jgi:molecular chaperone DnaK (HSP70)